MLGLAMAGRKPAPTHLKLVKGNPGKRALPKAEPKVDAAIPKRPAHLSDKAKSAWNVVAPMLAKAKVLSTADAMALELLCEAYSDYLAADKQLKDFGSNYYETKNNSGGVMHRAHPAVAAKRDADRRIKAWLAEFGMTPSARTRISTAVNGEESEDPAEKYF
jgi:P27 family predicted phage terminase small subunit